MSMSTHVVGVVSLLALAACGSAVQAQNGVEAARSPSDASTSIVSAPRGVGAVSVDELAQIGIYLGSPGTMPAGTPPFAHVTVPATMVQGSANEPSTGLSSEQQAVAGDPANGRSRVTASQAVRIALTNAGGFSGPPMTGQPVLVQYVNIYAGVIATAWAVPLNGVVELSRGPAPTGDTATIAPSAVPSVETARVISFVDAYTGKFIAQDSFGH